MNWSWKKRYRGIQRCIQTHVSGDGNEGQNGSSKESRQPIIGPCCLMLCIVTVLYGSFFTVDQGVRAVVLRVGEVKYVAEPGFHFKIPFIDSVIKMSVRTQKETITLQVYSKDIQAAEAGISLNFSLSPAFVSSIYGKYGESYLERIIVPQLMAQPKDVFGKYNAVDIVQNREELTAKMFVSLSKVFNDTGIEIKSVQIENIDFSNSYEKSVEERMRAEVEVQKVLQNEKRTAIEANMKRIRAKGDADAKIVAAEADAKAIKMRGEAEAKAIEAKSAAMARNPAYVHLLQAERWNGSLPTTMLPNNALPIIGEVGSPLRAVKESPTAMPHPQNGEGQNKGELRQKPKRNRLIGE